LRIGLIRMRYSPFGGAEVFLKRFIEELGKRGHSIEVFSTDWPEGPGHKVFRISAKGPSFLRPLMFARNVEKAVKEARPDITISLDRTYSQDIYRGADGCHREWLIRRARVVSGVKRLSMRLSPLHRTILHLEKTLFSGKGLKCVVAISERCKEEYIRHYGLPEDMICVIYCGVDTDEFNPERLKGLRQDARKGLGVSERDVVILFAGSGFERKGLKFLIRALGVLKHYAGLRLVVAGKGSPWRYEEEARALGVRERVMFLGPRRDMLNLYSASDIFCLPSVYEPFSNACLEAMASGLPVVASRAVGASEIIRHGQSGAIVEDPADAKGLADAIATLLDEGRRRSAGMASRATAERHTIEAKVTEFLGVIERVAHDKATKH
jgi:UDP-glucose:(heptosyl)LPS alpha-1,3-glucosyltransferase